MWIEVNILLINQSVGIFDDMINYNVIYFDRRAVERNYLNHVIDIDTAFSYYDELRRSKNKLDPPECLYPFFHLYNDRACVFSEYFHLNYNFCKDTIESFIHNNRMFAERAFYCCSCRIEVFSYSPPFSNHFEVVLSMNYASDFQ